MKYFYKIIAIGLLCSVSVSSFSQGTNWRINGNINTNPTNNFLGTVNNFGLSIRTNNIQRQKLNGSLSYAVNGFVGNRDGFMQLGFSQTYATNLFNNLGAFSLLHLNGNEGAFVQDAGYRPWMRTGVTFTDNNDLSYLGIRKVGNGTDITETVLSWSDNSGTNLKI